MDALLFFKERQRMCDSFMRCANCPFMGMNCLAPSSNEEAEEMVEAVEKWSKSYPITTNKMKYEETFKKLFPGMLDWKCAKNIPVVLCEYFDEKGGCPECEKFWSSEYKEKK